MHCYHPSLTLWIERGKFHWGYQNNGFYKNYAYLKCKGFTKKDTVPTFKMYNVGTLSTFKMHNVVTVSTFKMHSIGAPILYNLFWAENWNLGQN